MSLEFLEVLSDLLKKSLFYNILKYIRRKRRKRVNFFTKWCGQVRKCLPASFLYVTIPKIMILGIVIYRKNAMLYSC